MKSIESYYRILGLPMNASEHEVRLAFRRLAKEWHPDRNPDPSASGRFMEIHEAYDYLMDHLKRGGNPWKSYTQADSYREPTREEILERARAAARQRYEDYLNSEDYKTDMTHIHYNYLFGFILSCLLLFYVPFKVWLIKGTPAMTITLILVGMAFPLWLPGISNIRKLERERLKGSFHAYFSDSLVAQFLVFVFSGMICVSYCMDVFVRPGLLFGVITLLSIGVWLYLRAKQIRYIFTGMMAIAFAEILLSLFLVINQVGTFYVEQEQYQFPEAGAQYYYDSRGVLKSTDFPVFLLTGNKYEEFPGVRFYLEDSEVKYRQVKLETAYGLFGIRYLVDKEFSK